MLNNNNMLVNYRGIVMNLNNIVNYTKEALELVEKLYLEASGQQKKELQKVMAKLILMDEELDKNSEKKDTTQRQKIKNKGVVYVVACYLSRFGHEDIFKNLNQTQSLKKIAEILSIKHTTLKGTRDVFDPFFDNDRKGWNGRPLNEQELKIYNKYKNKSKNEFLNEVKNILGKK